MEAEAQGATTRFVTYEILEDPEDPMHPINRLLKGLDPKLELPAAFTLRDPLDGSTETRSFPGLKATFENMGLRLDGSLTPTVRISGRLEFKANDHGVIGSLRLIPTE